MFSTSFVLLKKKSKRTDRKISGGRIKRHPKSQPKRKFRIIPFRFRGMSGGKETSEKSIWKRTPKRLASLTRGTWKYETGRMKRTPIKACFI